MAIGLMLNGIITEVGTADFLFAFFSTVCSNLEPDGWGSRYPTIMGPLYDGQLAQSQAAQALVELEHIANGLRALPPDRVVWDFENPSATPPWGDNIAADITSLETYFVTSGGQDFMELLRELLTELRDEGGSLEVTEI